MKYFTNYLLQKASDSEHKTIEDSYLKQLKKDKKFFTKELLEYVDTEPVLRGLHDEEIRSFDFNQRDKVLNLKVKCGDLQVGYRELKLEYIGAEVVGDLDSWRMVTILAEEVGLTTKGGRKYSHSMIFSDNREIEIMFDEFSFAIKPLNI